MGPRQQALVTALRSGRFKQGTGCLIRVQDNERLHCCLGVACVVAQELGLKIESHQQKEKIVFATRDALYLPAEVQDFFKFRNNAGFPEGVYTDSEDRLRGLANMNDALRPFEEIADAINDSYFTEEV